MSPNFDFHTSAILQQTSAFPFTAHVRELTQCALMAQSVHRGDMSAQEQMDNSMIHVVV